MKDHIEEILAVAMLIVTVATPIAHGLLALAERLEEAAKLTPTPADDAPARRFADFMRRAVALLARIASWVPRLTVGARRNTALLVLLVVVPFGLGTGCAGGQHVDTLRSTLLVADGAVDRVDRDIEPLYQAAHARAQAEAVDRADYERRMQRWNRVDAAIEGVQVSLRSAALTLETVAEGVAGEVLASIACAVESLTVLADLLPLVGVNVPPTVQTVIALLRGFSSGACPAPPEPEPEPPASTSAEVTS